MMVSNNDKAFVRSIRFYQWHEKLLKSKFDDFGFFVLSVNNIKTKAYGFHLENLLTQNARNLLPCGFLWDMNLFPIKIVHSLGEEIVAQLSNYFFFVHNTILLKPSCPKLVIVVEISLPGALGHHVLCNAGIIAALCHTSLVVFRRPCELKYGEHKHKVAEVVQVNSITQIVQVDRNTDVFMNDEIRCSICLESYLEGMKIVVTCCRHVFHENCIEIWVSNKDTCPLCRSVMNI